MLLAKKKMSGETSMLIKNKSSDVERLSMMEDKDGGEGGLWNL